MDSIHKDNPALLQHANLRDYNTVCGDFTWRRRDANSTACQAAAEEPAGEDIREAMDIDSMDILNLVIALHKRTGIDIPEADYGKLITIGGAVTYLSSKSGG